MRIALLYPPPWKLPEPGALTDPVDGPPADYQPGDLDGDFHQTPYGLLTLAAQAIRAGHEVKVINLSAYPWTQVEQVVAKLDAELFGLSCWTANRRGAALVADTIKKLHPKAHVLVGGPHASPLAKEMLAHHRAIDTVSGRDAHSPLATSSRSLVTGCRSLRGVSRRSLLAPRLAKYPCVGFQ